MVFSSLEFLFLFLPIFLLIYFLLPARHRNLCLFAGSVLFYAFGTWSRPVYILLLLLSVLINYMLGMAMLKKPRRKRLWLRLGLLYNFGWLFVFKYADFCFGNLNRLLKSCFPAMPFSLPALNLILPIGISFYTFQIASYLIDVYRAKIPAERSLLRLGTYLCMFPQLIAGPIVSYRDVRSALQHRTVCIADISSGLQTFVIGLGYKVILANQIGRLWNDVNTIGYESLSTPLAWMGIAAYSFQIYFDFCGYSLMAIGLGKLLGFQLPRNFDYPYLSTSMTEFWRRWHITLGSWFREYIYIPLGGNRRGKRSTVRNLLIVWLLTGLWHGADWNFIIWGLLLFALLTLEKAGLGNLLNRYRAIGHLYMLFWIPVSWLLFAVRDLKQLWIYLGRLFPIVGNQEAVIFAGDYIKYGKMYGLLLLAGVLFSTKIPLRVYNRIKNNWIGAVILLAIFWVSVYCLYIGLDDPFLYFRF